jgi:outer membrane lipoprotein LolB
MPTFRPLILAAVLALAGCATTENLSQAPVPAYRENVTLAGKIGVNYVKKGNPESVSVGFDWVQAGQDVDVTLTSPLGQTMARIAVTPTSATLLQSDQQPRSARDIDTLTAQALGWSLPVSGLRDWLQGYATAADGSRFAASPANNSVTTQDGWRLRFSSWQDPAAAHPLPKLINAERSATATTDELTIRIVLYAKD